MDFRTAFRLPKKGAFMICSGYRRHPPSLSLSLSLPFQAPRRRRPSGCRNSRNSCNFNQTSEYSFGDIKPSPNWLHGNCASHIMVNRGGECSNDDNDVESPPSCPGAAVSMEDLPNLEESGCLHGGRFSLQGGGDVVAAVICHVKKYLL